MVLTRVLMVAILLAASGSAALGDWVETNNDAGIPGKDLDYEGYWAAAYDGGLPKPATSWSTAAQLNTDGFGSDDGWTGNVIKITDADATRFAAENHVDSFFDVCVTAATSTYDTNEEFGVMARASYFANEGSIATLDAYAATFSANDAAPGQPMKFSLYKIVNGMATIAHVANPLAEASYDDYIVSIELTVIDNDVTARLFEDTGDTVPIATLNIFDDPSPLSAGYSGVLCWDAEADGIGVLYDTLSSIAVPEPGTLTLLMVGLGVVLLPICRLRRRRP